jgi:hypothetical protein
MIVLAFCMSGSRRVVFGFCASRSVVVVAQARSRSYRCRGGDYGAESEEHDRVCEAWYQLWLAASVPHPAGSHHDVNLEQKSAEAGGFHEFGFSGVWADRCSRGAGQGPQSGGTDIAHDPGGEHCRSDPSQEYSRPNQLEQRN